MWSQQQGIVFSAIRRRRPQGRGVMGRRCADMRGGVSNTHAGLTRVCALCDKRTGLREQARGACMVRCVQMTLGCGTCAGLREQAEAQAVAASKHLQIATCCCCCYIATYELHSSGRVITIVTVKMSLSGASKKGVDVTAPV